MMIKKLRSLPIRLMVTAAVVSLLPVMTARAQNNPDSKVPGTPAQGSPTPAAAPAASPIQLGPVKPALAAPGPGATAPAAPVPDRALAYYHVALANTYEEEAVTQGRPELVTQAIEQYKLALNADPASPQLSDGLADLYFRTGRPREAESTARELLKTSPDDTDAHKLLGRIFLRSLSEDQNAPSSASPSGNVLDQAIAEYEKIVSLEPKSVEDRMVLGQLYIVKHEQKKAEEQFKIAQSIDPDAEEVVLNLARVYAESGDLARAAKVIEAVPVADRTAKMEVALGASYDQMKKTKDAIAAYQRAVDMAPEDVRTQSALAQALLNDNQLDAALKQYKDLAEADPEDADNLIHIGEIQRRQGKFEDALVTIRKARKKAPDSLEAGYNEGLLLDVLGRYDEAAQVYEKMVDLTSHANGAYTAEEKSNRGIFLERLGTIYHEQNKTDQALAVYQKMIDMGGEAAYHGFEFEVDSLSEAKLYDRAVEASRKAVEFSHKAVEANPKNADLKTKDLEVNLMLGGALVEQGKVDEGLALTKGLLGNPTQDRLVWLKLGQYYTQLHRWKEAEDAYAKADPLTTKNDDRVYLFFLKGALAERQKHYEPAEQFFRQALVLDPSNAGALNYLGYMLADKGARLPEALKLIRKAVELEPMNGAYLDSLGWVYFKLGEYELAEENLRRAVERDQTDPTVHDHLGDLYEKTGRIRLAAAQWELSLTQYAKSSASEVEPADVAKVQRKLETARVKLAKQESANGQPKPE